MKKFSLLLVALISISTMSAQSSDNEDLRQKIEERKKEFIKNELQLTEEEEKDFWPILDAYKEEQKKLKDAYPERDLSLLSDDEAEQLLSDMIDRERKMTDLKSTYMEKMSEVLNPRKVIKCFRLENDFKRSLLKRYKDRMSGFDRRSNERSLKEKKGF